MDRRDFLRSLGLLALAPSACVRLPGPEGDVVNDIHSGLNATRVARVVAPGTVADVQRTVRSSGVLCIAGGRHAMGGQQFCAGATLLDTRRLARVLAFDRSSGTIEVEAGIQWPALVDYLAREQRGPGPAWSIRQKQTGADRLCIGGALSANVHGRGLSMKPFIDDVESFTLINADGERIACSRTENRELFTLAIGGYGLFGVIASVKLRLQPRHNVRRVVELREIDDIMPAFEQRIADGFTYGDFQYSTDPASDNFLRRGIFSCYQPVDDSVPATPGKQLTDRDWRDMLMLAHVDKARAYELYTSYYLSTHGRVYDADEHQMSIYPDGYHRAIDSATGATSPGSEMITEIYVPRSQLADFMREAAEDFRRNSVEVIYGTVRLITADDESFMAWARKDYACIIFNLHVSSEPARLEAAASAFRRLIDMGIRRGGSYYLTYHRWATRGQVLACYPQFPEFLRLKKTYDPAERYQSEWYRHYTSML